MLRFVRFVFKQFGLLKKGPGSHRCWRCSLHGVANGRGVCTIMVIKPGAKEPSLIIMDLGETCVWKNLPPESLCSVERDHLDEALDEETSSLDLGSK